MAHRQHLWMLLVIAVLAVAAWPAAAGAGQGETVNLERQSIKAVRGWLEAYVDADVDAAMGVSGVPFSWDRKELIKTRAELRTKYEEAFKSTATIDLQTIEIELVEDPGLKGKGYLGKEKDILTVLIRIGDEGILAFVRPGERFLVVGLSD